MNYKRLLFTISTITILLNAEANPALDLQTAKDNFTQATNQATTTQPIAKKSLTISEAATKAINTARSKAQICSQPVAPLKWNSSLYQIAKEHSIDMAVNTMLSHNGSGGPYDKTAKRLGLRRGSFFYERVNQEKDSKKVLSSELVIRTDKYNYKSPSDIINYWIRIPQNCKIIMDKRFSDFAMAKVISNKDNKVYWTLLLIGARQK